MTLDTSDSLETAREEPLPIYVILIEAKDSYCMLMDSLRYR